MRKIPVNEYRHYDSEHPYNMTDLSMQQDVLLYYGCEVFFYP